MKKIVLAVLIIIGANFAHAQNTLSSKNARALSAYQRSNIAINQRMYNTAIRDLEEALRNDPNFVEAHFRLADVYKISKEFKKALASYQMVQALNPKISKHLDYELGETYFYLHAYDTALMYFETYSKVLDLSENRQKELNKYLRNTRYSIEAVKKPVPYKPMNMGININTSNQEYLPTITADDSTLIFTRRSNQEDFYISKRTSAGWDKAVTLSTAINTTGNEGAQCISPDGQYLYFAGCSRPDGLGKCDIYYSKLVGNEWSKPVNLGEPVNSMYWESQPSISPDGKTLYFVSDRKGGYGSYDIYRSTYLGDNKWSRPVNLGPAINTEGVEFSPFIHNDNQTLYFSSNGWPGFGDNDIFFSRKEPNGKWGAAQNIGYPINTSQEESSLFISNNGKNAFFASSTLKGEGGLDLFSFELHEAARPLPVTYVKGLVFDKLTKNKLGSSIEIIDISNGDTVAITNSNEASGQFLASLPSGKTYAFNVYSDGYLFHSDQFVLTNKRTVEPFKLMVPLEPIRTGAKIALKNIFYESGSFKLKNESLYEITKLVQFLKENPAVRIEISGHTDNVGVDQTNLTLSTNRAKSVYDWLVKQGIAADRLVYKGYGKSQPVDVNTTEEGRAKNRRTEVKVL
jgi:outer membrane protein OmpA-like peptidoglycan-associated protein